MTENRSGFERSRFLLATPFVPNEGPPNPEQSLCRNSQARSDKRGCEGRLRSSTCSKLLSTCRGTRRLCFCFLAEGGPEHCQASQRCPQRRRLPVFEPANPAGTRT